MQEYMDYLIKNNFNKGKKVQTQRSFVNDKLESMECLLSGGCLIDLSTDECLYVFHFTDEESIIDEMAHYLLGYIYDIEYSSELALKKVYKSKIQNIYNAIFGTEGL